MEEEILQYLKDNPVFLINNAQALGIKFEESKIRSFAEAQIIANQVKFDKINKEVVELFSNAEANQNIIAKLEKLYLKLLQSKTLQDTLNAIENSLINDFELPLFVIKLLGPKLEIDEKYLLDPENDALAKIIDLKEPVSGNTCITQELYTWFPDNVQPESVLHLPLINNYKFLGIIIIGSKDQYYFTKDMAKDYVKSMAKAISITVDRILN